jgi:hypothetical protein
MGESTLNRCRPSVVKTADACLLAPIEPHVLLLACIDPPSASFTQLLPEHVTSSTVREDRHVPCGCKCLQAAAHLQPRPLVVFASSDSDMQQLMDSHTYWLELLQVRQPGLFTSTNDAYA